MKDNACTNPLALIVEDDGHLASIYSQALQAAQYTTETVLDGNTALDRLRKIVPAVVVLDLHLPIVSGKDVLTEIRSNERLAQTKVMITTADATLAENLAGDSDLVLLKPIGFDQLRDLAARLRPSDSVAV